MAKDGPITRKPADETATKVLGLESTMTPPEGWEAFFCRLADDTRPRPSAMDLTWVTLYWKQIFEHYLSTDISDDLDEEYSLGIDWCCTKTIIAAACEARGIDSSAIFKAHEWFEEYRRLSGIGYEWSREDLPPSWFPGPPPEMRPGEVEMTSNVKQLLFRLDGKLHAELQQDDNQGDTNSVLAPKVARRERVDMANIATADKFRKIAKAFRAWGKLGPGNTKETRQAAVVALTLAIENLHLINRAKDAYGFPDDALYNVLEQLGRMAINRANLEKQLGAYDRMTQKQLPGDISFPIVLERWATELEKAGSVGDGLADSGKGGKPIVDIPKNLKELQTKIYQAKGDAQWNIICLVAETGQDAAPDRNGVMRAYRPCCCTVCGITDGEFKNAENRLAYKRNKNFKKQFKAFKKTDVAVAIKRIVKPELDRRIASLHASKKG